MADLTLGYPGSAPECGFDVGGALDVTKATVGYPNLQRRDKE